MLFRHTALALSLAAAASASPVFPTLNVQSTDGIVPNAGPAGTGNNPAPTLDPTLDPMPNPAPEPTADPTVTDGGLDPTETSSSLPGSTGTGSTGTGSMGGVVAYWGQSGGSLDDVCKDDAFSAVVLSFVTSYFNASGYPAMNLGSALGGPSPAQKSAGATGLLDGAPLAGAIKACQSSGKKMFISLGGYNAPSAVLKDDSEGKKLADTIWNLFLGGSDAKTKPLRPFGDVTLDGVDLDIENKAPAGYTAMVDQLRSHFKSDSKRSYYISAAPQCPRNGGKGDASISDETLKKVDYVWVQFYNNPECNHGENGFTQAVKDWAAAVAPAQLFIGAPGSQDSAGSGYVDVPTMQKEVKANAALNLPNLGGWMLWEADTAIKNNNYQQAVAKALSGSGSTSGKSLKVSHRFRRVFAKA